MTAKHHNKPTIYLQSLNGGVIFFLLKINLEPFLWSNEV